jgi:hypothetical protein
MPEFEPDEESVSRAAGLSSRIMEDVRMFYSEPPSIEMRRDLFSERRFAEQAEGFPIADVVANKSRMAALLDHPPAPTSTSRRCRLARDRLAMCAFSAGASCFPMPKRNANFTALTYKRCLRERLIIRTYSGAVRRGSGLSREC